MLHAGAAARAAGDDLISALRDKDPAVKQYAATVLGRAGIREAIPALTSALKDEDIIVREAAALSLRMLGVVNIAPPTIKKFQRKSKIRLNR